MIRLIPNLIIENKQAVKRKAFKKYKYLGDPFNIVKILNDKCIDELIITNISVLQDNDIDYIQKLNGVCFMPLCYGGGIRTLGMAKKIMNVGVERIHLNTLIYENYNELEKIVYHLGGSSVICVINIKIINNEIVYVSSCGKENINENITDVINKLIKLNISEIMINNVCDENSKKGYSDQLIKFVSMLPAYNYLINCGMNKDDVENSDFVSHNSISGLVGSNYFFCHGRYDGVLVSYDR